MMTESTAPPCLIVRGVSKTFRDGGRVVHALDDVSFSAQPGEFVTIIGPSGSGKSTLFNLITGLAQPDSGSIELSCATGTATGAAISAVTGAAAGPGEDRRARAGRVGYMPQRDLLLPWRTVLDNVILGPEIDGRSRREARTQARDLLGQFGLEGFAHAFPNQLSGGMRQRAALLRTFLTGRDVLLLDEPFGALDALTRRELQRWLLEVWGHFGKTILFITHDVEEAVFLGDRVLVFSARPGRIARELRVDVPRPRETLAVLSEELRHLEADLFATLQTVNTGGAP